MLGRPLAIADAEWYTGSEWEREREAALLIVPVWESMEDWTRLENTLNLSISEYSNSALICHPGTKPYGNFKRVSKYKEIWKSDIWSEVFQKRSHWVYLLYKQNSLAV